MKKNFYFWVVTCDEIGSAWNQHKTFDLLIYWHWVAWSWSSAPKKLIEIKNIQKKTTIVKNCLVDNIKDLSPLKIFLTRLSLKLINIYVRRLYLNKAYQTRLNIICNANSPTQINRLFFVLQEHSLMLCVWCYRISEFFSSRSSSLIIFND